MASRNILYLVLFCISLTDIAGIYFSQCCNLSVYVSANKYRDQTFVPNCLQT